MDRSNNRYEIRYTKAADKFFRKHEEIRSLYEESIHKLLSDQHPELVDVKRVQGKRGLYYRIRIGDVRIIYTIINRKIIVVNTLLAGFRGDIYKKMDGLK